MTRAYRPKLDIKYDEGYVDMVRTYSFLLDELELNKKNWTMTLEDAVFNAINKKFHAYMLTNREEYRHMFEWKGSRPLWLIEKALGVVSWTYLESKQKVPPSGLPYEKYKNHIFREKAQMFEEAASVTIAPVNSKYLRWRGESVPPGRYIDGDESQIEVIKYGVLEIDELGGGQFRNKFQNAFLMYWAAGGDMTMQEISAMMANDPGLNLGIKKNKIAGLKRAITMQRGKAKNRSLGNKARHLAKEKYLQFERELKQLEQTL